MDWIIQYDYQLFEFINKTLSNDFFDWILPIMRDKYTWIPVYFFFVIFAFYNFSWKKALAIIVLTFVVFGMADFMSSQIIKEYFIRPRPCHANSEVDVRLLVTCGSGFSFTSSHATNHMAISVFLAFTMFRYNKLALILLISWAAIISFSQVYVGVHYPIDVMVGMLLGTMIGLLGIGIFRMLERRFLNRQASPN